MSDKNLFPYLCYGIGKAGKRPDLSLRKKSFINHSIKYYGNIRFD